MGYLEILGNNPIPSPSPCGPWKPLGPAWHYECPMQPQRWTRTPRPHASHDERWVMWEVKHRRQGSLEHSGPAQQVGRRSLLNFNILPNHAKSPTVRHEYYKLFWVGNECHSLCDTDVQNDFSGHNMLPAMSMGRSDPPQRARVRAQKSVGTSSLVRTVHHFKRTV